MSTPISVTRCAASDARDSFLLVMPREASYVDAEGITWSGVALDAAGARDLAQNLLKFAERVESRNRPPT